MKFHFCTLSHGASDCLIVLHNKYKPDWHWCHFDFFFLLIKKYKTLTGHLMMYYHDIFHAINELSSCLCPRVQQQRMMGYIVWVESIACLLLFAMYRDTLGIDPHSTFGHCYKMAYTLLSALYRVVSDTAQRHITSEYVKTMSKTIFKKTYIWNKKAFSIKTKINITK